MNIISSSLDVEIESGLHTSSQHQYATKPLDTHLLSVTPYQAFTKTIGKEKLIATLMIVEKRND
ncbi:MAG: hypothetical protein WCK35_19040 [Chloroflexota bacterium]